jgi:hypothetical protein
MATFEVLSNGDIRVEFPENGSSYTIPGAATFGVGPGFPNWHEYTASITLTPGTMDANYHYLSENVTLADVRLALLQQTAPEWQSVFGYEQYDPRLPPVVNGDMTETPLSGFVYHLVSEDGLIVLNITATDETGNHPFHPGYVIRTVVENSDGSFTVISYGIGNAETGGITNGAATAFFNRIMGHQLFDNDYNLFNQAMVNALYRIGEECFLAGTEISLSSGGHKFVEDVVSGDVILSYDAAGALFSGRVTRTFRNEVSHLLDVHGLKVTPGHVTLCGSGMFAGRHVPVIDILLSDGALVTAEGGLVRMSINRPVGSVEDRMAKVLYALTVDDARSGQLRDGEMRVGTLLFDRDGVPVSVLDCLKAEGLVFDPETGLVAKPGAAPHPLHWFGVLPKPEDYILARSRETLEGILVDGDWEGSRSELIVGRLRQTAGVMN